MDKSRRGAETFIFHWCRGKIHINEMETSVNLVEVFSIRVVSLGYQVVLGCSGRYGQSFELGWSCSRRERNNVMIQIAVYISLEQGTHNHCQYTLQMTGSIESRSLWEVCGVGRTAEEISRLSQSGAVIRSAHLSALMVQSMPQNLQRCCVMAPRTKKHSTKDQKKNKKSY